MFKLILFLTIFIVSSNCSPSSFCVRFETNVENSTKIIVLNVTENWAPIGVRHFYKIVNSSFYSVPAAFFRVVPNFVVQFGISGEPKQNQIWKNPIVDDPVKLSNLIGTVSYATAGPNTRTTQIFINYIDNARLDPLGFAPFAVITEGFDVALKIFNPTPGSTDGVDQDQYSTKGNEWILANYPKINFVEKVSIGSNCPLPKDKIELFRKFF